MKKTFSKEHNYRNSIFNSIISSQKNGLGRRLLIAVFLVSSIFTILQSSFQLYTDYQLGLGEIDRSFDQIYQSNNNSIFRSLWNISIEGIETSASGILSLPNVEYVQISEVSNKKSELKTLITMSSLKKENLISKIFDIKSTINSKEIILGKLEIKTCLNTLYSDLYDKFLLIVFFQSIKTFSVSILIFAVFHYLVTQHLIHMAEFAKKINEENLDEILTLQRKNPNQIDELEFMVQALNSSKLSMKKMLEFSQNSLRLKLELEQKEHQEHVYAAHSFQQKKLNEIITKSLEKTKEAKKAADKANESKSVFVANMSHEIRTPMNAILGFSSILKKTSVDKQSLQHINFILNSGEHLMKIINDILDFSKMEAGKVEIHHESTSLRDIVESVTALFSLEFKKKKDLDFIVEIDTDMPKYLLLDAARINQVLINIISNAIKFTSHGYVKLSILTVKNQTQDTVSLAINVEDSGKGIPEDQFNRVFTSFEQIKGQKSSDYEGTGLGMAICKNLINLMNGDISIESNVGVGTTFKLLFKNVEIAQQVEDSQDSIDCNDYVFSTSEIIYLKHNLMQEHIIKAYLADFPFNITVVDSVKELNEKFKNNQIDLIICDTKNDEIYRELFQQKGKPKNKNIHVIKLTASKSDESITLNENISYFLTKPFYQEGLINTISKCLPCTVLPSIKSDNLIPVDLLFTDKQLNALSEKVVRQLILSLDKEDPEKYLEYLLSSGDIEAIIIFANILKTFGSDNMEPSLSALGRELIEQVDVLNLDKIEILLNHMREKWVLSLS